MANHRGARGKHQGPSEPRFAGRGQREIACPDCVDNALSPPSPPDPEDPRGRQIRRAPSGCETCGGTRRIPKPVRPRRKDESLREYEEDVYGDPYEKGAMKRAVERLSHRQSSSPPTTA